MTKVIRFPVTKFRSSAYLYSMRVSFLILYLCLGLSLSAQTAFTIYNTTNSIFTSNLVNCIVHDEAGNMWVGTEAGLAYRSASGDWTLYTEADGLPGNEVRALMLDGDKVFIGTYLDGMAIMEGGVFTYFDPINSPLPDYHIKCFARDSQDTIWIGTSWGLTKWDGADFWHTYTEVNSDLLVPNINAMYMDSNDILYAGTLNGGMARYNDGNFEIFRTLNSDIGDNTILSIAEDIYNNKWIATSFGSLTVLTADDVFLRFTPLTSDISDWSIDAVRLDHDNLAFIGMTSTGLELFDNVNWTQFTSENSDLPDNVIHAISIAPDNIAWIGTDNGGLVAFNKLLVENIRDDAPSAIPMYPNPATDLVYLGNWSSDAQVLCYDMQGKKQAEGKAVNGVWTISVYDLPVGNYMVQVTDGTLRASGILTVVH